MTAEWHYGEEEPDNGPVSLEELKQRVASGECGRPGWSGRRACPSGFRLGKLKSCFPNRRFSTT